MRVRSGFALVLGLQAFRGTPASAPECEKDSTCGADTKAASLLQANLHRGTIVLAEDGAPKPDGGLDDCAVDKGETVELTVDGKTRCFQLYTPSTATMPMPVIIFFHGSGSRASATFKANKYEYINDADRLGYALIGGDAYVNWQFPRIGDVGGAGSANPRPCSSEDTPDYDYVSKIFAKLEANPTVYDLNKVYMMGFSQGAAFTTWAATCFATKIRGASQAGGGLKLRGSTVTSSFCDAMPPALTAKKGDYNPSKCKAGDTDGINTPGGSCSTEPCEFFPLQPAKLTNVVGEDLKWCIFAGCDDYNVGSIYSMKTYLDSISAPNNLQHYDGAHNAPTGYIRRVYQCHGIATGTPDDEPGISCPSLDVTGTDGGQQGGGGGGGGGARAGKGAGRSK